MLKSLVLLASMMFAAPAFSQSVSADDATPNIVCKNENVTVEIYNHPGSKEAQMVVLNHQQDSVPQTLFEGLVFPVITDDTQFFVGGPMNLYVVAQNLQMTGFLNFDRSQPGVEQVMQCEQLFKVQPIGTSAE